MRKKLEQAEKPLEGVSNLQSNTLNISPRKRDKNAIGSFSTASRASRTRTLIQLGGLLDKAGLVTTFDISLGDDLQRDEDTFGPAATLLGALLELNTQLQDDSNEHQRRLWRLKGKKALME